VFTRVGHRTLPWASSIQSLPPPLLSVDVFLIWFSCLSRILSSRLCTLAGLTRWLVPACSYVAPFLMSDDCSNEFHSWTLGHPKFRPVDILQTYLCLISFDITYAVLLCRFNNFCIHSIRCCPRPGVLVCQFVRGRKQRANHHCLIVIRQFETVIYFSVPVETSVQWVNRKEDRCHSCHMWGRWGTDKQFSQWGRCCMVLGTVLWTVLVMLFVPAVRCWLFCAADSRPFCWNFHQHIPHHQFYVS
jgi:hypothetical protein